MRTSLACLLILSTAAASAGPDAGLGGHTKFRLEAATFPDDSLFRQLAGTDTADISGDLRLELSVADAGWTLDADYQLIAVQGDTPEWTRDATALPAALLQRLPGDERRLLDLTHVARDAGRTAIVHRLDRLALGFTGAKTVLRFGRQALSWGNGFFYAPMDLVNPFDPAAIDTEFKPGDDLVYAQYLRENGDDLQAAVVFRRDPLSGDVDRTTWTSALKYHGFAGATEYDLLLAESYGDTVLGAGIVRSVGGAVLRGDVVLTDTGRDRYAQAVANLSYSWVLRGRNMSGTLEAYFNGFGRPAGDYGPDSLAGSPELTDRLERRELFALGRFYLAGSVLVEMTPLWTLTPTLLVNVADPSALFQLVTQHSLGDNLVVLASLNLPVGAAGTEFGGIDSGLPATDLGRGASLFAQLAWYF